jgi:glycosyltransferase involved in cell wall biosynthesis
MKNSSEYQNVMVVGNPGMVFRLNAFLMALASEKFNGSVTYCGFKQAAKWKKLYLRPLDWVNFVANLILSDTILIVAACHHSNSGRVALRVARFFRKRLIVDFYISHYETRVLDRKLYAPDSKEAKRFWKWDRQALEMADLVLFLNAAEKEYYCRSLGLDPKGIKSMILPVTNDHQFRAAALPWHSGKTERPRFAWWGREVTNPIHGLDLIIQSFQQAEQAGELVLCLNSEEDRHRLLEKYSELEKCPWIMIRTDLHFADGSLPAFLASEIDFAIGPLGESDKSKVVVANKVIDAISLGIPVITQRSKGMRELLHKPVIKACFTYSEVFKQGERKIDPPKVDVRAFQEACRHNFLEIFSMKQFGHKLRSILNGLSAHQSNQ